MMTFTREQLATLREAAQNYQSMLAWYQEKPDSPNAEQDCDAALAAFKCEIRHREVDIIAYLLDELEAAKSKLNEQREYYEGVIAVGSKRIAELSENRLAGSPTIPDEVLSAIRKVARMRVDSVTFDGDKRGLINALDEAEDALILTVSEYADEIAAAEIKD